MKFSKETQLKKKNLPKFALYLENFKFYKNSSFYGNFEVYL